ncbi:hypothetical protein [Spirosoma sp.]|uniref:hypothetical protein n=1 Tax=Spirosoma sp. TaxID=1899569 RepID=UPI00260DA094|nr:hypothetical protein [Spirosoma sp.]MCX6217631.1 hypothetical protein [Spirosoma sp.]
MSHDEAVQALRTRANHHIRLAEEYSHQAKSNEWWKERLPYQCNYIALRIDKYNESAEQNARHARRYLLKLERCKNLKPKAHAQPGRT